MDKRRHFYRTALLTCFCLVLLLGCSKKIGYGVVNWSLPEYNLNATDIVPVLVKSNISKVYIVEINKQKVEIPLWQLTFFDSHKKAQAYINKLAEYRSIYAVVKLDGLPLRASPDSTGKQLYRLRENQTVKVLWKGEGEPVIARDKPLEGDWLQVMTNDGTQGWCFSYNLHIYDERNSTMQPAVAEETVDEMLQSILTSRWYPDYYRDMILKKQVDPELIAEEFGFFPAADPGLARIVLKDTALSFRYAGIRKNRMGAYLFENSPLIMQIRNEDTIGVHYTDEKGRTEVYYFVTLEEDPIALAAEEQNRRNAVLQSFVDIGPLFRSGNYGMLQFTEDHRFLWTGHTVLSPSIIPAGSGNTGMITIRAFMSSKLKTEYQGVVSFQFDGSTEWVDFFYTLSMQGLKMEYVKPEHIKNGTAVERNLNPVILFFGNEGADG